MRRRRGPTEPARETAQEARTWRLWNERRLAWLERLDRDEPEALAGATPEDQRVIRRLYAKARECWPEDPPEGWEPSEQLEVGAFHTALGLNASQHGGRYRPQTYRAGQRLPNGRVVGQDQTETITVDVGIDQDVRAWQPLAPKLPSEPAEPPVTPAAEPPPFSADAEREPGEA
jgi:hypothetical protein